VDKLQSMLHYARAIHSTTGSLLSANKALYHHEPGSKVKGGSRHKSVEDRKDRKKLLSFVDDVAAEWKVVASNHNGAVWTHSSWLSTVVRGYNLVVVPLLEETPAPKKSRAKRSRSGPRSRDEAGTGKTPTKKKLKVSSPSSGSKQLTALTKQLKTDATF
jgi:hypothetical protein